ncbi:stress protein [Sutcliffiella halmapala]|uniref:stress protein n=1 Tax=Sutcliffiella halmapala TaxID=79882 RepID=UPI00099535DB|nr:stress protein [Sutcliffiella halmapala]
MKGRLHQALEQQREYYLKKLLLIGVYDLSILEKLTTSELKEEYNYFYNDVPSIKSRSRKKSNKA